MGKVSKSRCTYSKLVQLDLSGPESVLEARLLHVMY